MSYSKIYNEYVDEFSEIINDDFIKFLKELKDDYQIYDRSRQSEYLKRIGDYFNLKLKEFNIEYQSFFELWANFDEGVKKYINAPDKISYSIERNVIPIFDKTEYSISIENLIRLFAIQDNKGKIDRIIQQKFDKIQHNFKQNQINKVNIKKAKSTSKKSSPAYKESLDIEKRLFLFFLEKRLTDEYLENKSIDRYHNILDCDLTEYARLVAYSLGIKDENLSKPGKHNKSNIYRYINTNKFEIQKSDKKFLKELISDLEQIKLPRIILETINSFNDKVK